MANITHDELPLIDRPDLALALMEALQTRQELLLLGPGYWGKTDVLKSIEQRFSAQGGIVVYISLFTLRCRNEQTLEKEILRWLTQDEKMVMGYVKNNPNTPFQAYLEALKQQQKPILLLCDQLEDLSPNKQIQLWLIRFRKFLKENGMQVIWSDRVASCDKSVLKNLTEDAAHEITPLTKPELIRWLENPIFEQFSTRIALVEQLFFATSGIVGLIKNFALYLANNEFKENIVDDYIKYQSNLYSRSCHSILQSLRNYPEEINTWQTQASAELQEQLWQSGAFIKESGQLKISSIIYKNRIDNLITPENILKSGIRIKNINEFINKTVNEKNEWPAELVSEPLMYYFLRENDKQKILEDLRHYLNHLGFNEIEFNIRESQHWLIWYKIDINSKKDTRWFLKTNSVIYQSIHSGSLKVDQTGRCFIPLTGSSGLVNFVISGIPPQRIMDNSWKLEFYLRNIFSIIQNLSAIIMRAVDNYLLSYANKGLKSFFAHAEKNEMKDEKYSHRLLEEMNTAVSAKCVTCAIITSTNTSEKKWELCTLEYDKSALSNEKNLSNRLSDKLSDISNIETLDVISKYLMKSEKKYLIKSSDDLNDLAHWFYEDDTPITFYFRCVPVENGKILAIFVFPQQNHVAPVFNFFERQYLSLLALRFSRMEYLKRRLNKRHEHEIELLNKIGEATYLSLADPQQALDKILTAMQSFFNVRAIAINIIVDVYDSEDKKTHKETRMQKGLGYDPKYCEEEKHRLEGKSRTAYVARERKTIVAFYDKAKNQYNNYEFEQNDYGGESHPIKVDIGENESFCGFSLPEKKLYSYLGAPIIWQNIKTNEIEVIGVLKMANHQPIDVPFSNNQMASAMRIAKLLSPLIYMIQHRNEYGLEKQVEYLTVLFRGISHELKTPLAKLDNTLALLELEAESELNPEVSKLINKRLAKS